MSGAVARKDLRTLLNALIPAWIILTVLLAVGFTLVTVPGPLRPFGPAPSSSPSATPTPSAAATPDPAVVLAACTSARQQLDRGRPQAAHDLLTAAGITADNASTALAGDCRTVWVLSTPAPDAAKTPFQSFGAAWDSFVKGTFAPLGSSMAFVIGGWLGLFVLARLLVEAPPLRDLRSDRASRRTAAILGWVLLGVLPVAAVFAGVYASGHPIGVFLAIFLLGSAAVAVLGLAAWLATLRVVHLDVTADGVGDDGKYVTRPLITARLRELAGKTGSIEIPAGPAVSELADALKDMSATPWIAAVQKLVLFLIGVAPWNVTVTVQSARIATVTVTRNRKTLRTAVTRATGEGLDALATPPADRATSADILSVLSAAELLLALSECYPNEFEPALAGATVARSVALQFIAIRWYTGSVDTSSAVAILLAARRADPRNELARYSLEYVRHRHDTDRAALTAFGRRLDGWIEARIAAGFDLDDELLRGMVTARAACARNLAALAMPARLAQTPPADLGPTIDAIDAARTTLDRLAPSADASGDTLRAALGFSSAALTRARSVLLSSGPVASYADAGVALAAAQAAIPAAVAVPGAYAADSAAVQQAAVNTIRAASVDELFLADAARAYSLACELVCWERVGIFDSPPALLLEVATSVQVLHEFAIGDPELATAADFARWARAPGASRRRS